jgi:hypothetical protein
VALEKKRAGDKLSASADWNPLIEAVTRVQRAAQGKSSTPLMGVCTEVAEIYSVFEVYDVSSALAAEEFPVVGIRKPSSVAPLALFTNGSFPTVANKPSHIEPLMRDAQYKIAVSTSDTGFEIGAECGPLSGEYFVGSTGSGLLCLSDPVVYDTGKAYIWACVLAKFAEAIKFYHYEMTSGSDADISEFSGGSVGSFVESAAVYDPITMFSDQTVGDVGYCFKQDGYYYRIQGPCTTWPATDEGLKQTAVVVSLHALASLLSKVLMGLMADSSVQALALDQTLAAHAMALQQVL